MAKVKSDAKEDTPMFHNLVVSHGELAEIVEAFSATEHTRATGGGQRQYHFHRLSKHTVVWDTSLWTIVTFICLSRFLKYCAVREQDVGSYWKCLAEKSNFFSAQSRHSFPLPTEAAPQLL